MTQKADQQQQDNSNIDKWEVVDDHDKGKDEFQFIPTKHPGVNANLDDRFTAFRCFTTPFDNEVQEKLVTLVNDFS